jgi:dienelactone hydrolase
VPRGAGDSAAVVATLALTLALSASACSSSGSGSGSTGAASGRATYAVGQVVDTFVDAGRATPANGSVAGHPGRRLQTTIFYPVSGSAGNDTHRALAPDRDGGPYPLIVFAHGYGSSPAEGGYRAVMVHWAAAGYVVAAPRFPLTSDTAPGGPDLSDFAQQPADMSVGVDHVVAEAASPSGLLNQMVDGHEIGAAGHSLGGVTVLGLVADSCCRDTRIDAAVVMSGDAIAFPTGGVDFGPAPPLLLVHGDADPSVPYAASVEAFNAAHGPKGLLTMVGGDHGAPVNPAGRGFASVLRTTTDFFDAYLKHRAAARQRLPHDATTGATTLTFVAGAGVTTTIPVPTTVAGSLHATATPTQGLVDGQAVTVRWDGFAPGPSVNVLECAKNPPTAAADCDLQAAKLLQPDPTGAGSVTLVVHTGAVGSGGGLCDATHPGCVIAVNQGGSLDPASTVEVPIALSSG